MGTSASGTDCSEQGMAPLDACVSMNLEVKENPKTEIKYTADSEQEAPKTKVVQVGFSMTRDKLLQMTKDMKHAVNLLQVT